MSGTHFYLTLPSNASLDVFPDNKTTEYRVKLPQPIDLDGNWEVGLYSISYPNTWYTLRNLIVDTHFYYVEGTGWPSVATMKCGHYETMQYFVKNMNASLELEIGNSTTIYLTYSTLTGKVTVHLKPKCKLLLFGKMSLILGFGGKEVKIDKTGENPYVTDLSTLILHRSTRIATPFCRRSLEIRVRNYFEAFPSKESMAISLRKRSPTYNTCLFKRNPSDT